MTIGLTRIFYLIPVFFSRHPEKAEGLKVVVTEQANRGSGRAKEIHLLEIPFNPGIRLKITALAFKALHIMARG